MLMKPFNPFAPELLQGVNLIEASAGTGKTYSITTLVLRLLIERGLELRQILSVTFTEPAAKELRDRIRRRLVDARNYLAQPRTKPNADFDHLFHAMDVSSALTRLNGALSEIDVAPIYTIHGFCQRMLQDYAFETGQSFGAELVQDDSGFYQEMAEDFWRIIHAQYPQAYFRDSNIRLDRFYELAKPFSTHGIELNLPEPTFDDAQFTQQIAEVEQALRAVRVDILESAHRCLLEACEQGRMKYSHGKAEKVNEWFEACRCYFTSQSGQAPLIAPCGAWLEKLTPAEIEKNTKKGQSAPVHLFFEQIERIYNAGQALQAFKKQIELLLIKQFHTWAQREAERRKQATDIQFFDDLLQRLSNTLQADPDGRFCQLIRARFPAVLIDEFQDTDLVQWGIFGTVYAPHRMDPAKNSLLLIGDPKQSIYSFRNADIEVYLKAKASAGDQVWSMSTNYRSEPGVLAALNEWAVQVGNDRSFALPGAIEYERVEARPTWESGEFMDFPSGDASLMLVADFDPEATKEATRVAVMDAVANAAQYVLANNRLGGTSLNPGHLAVLVNTNAQALNIHRLLGQRNIPAVIVARESVFQSVVAQGLYHLMAAVLQPQDEKLARGALLTDLFMYTAADVAHWPEASWGEWIHQLREWSILWAQEGVAAFLADADNRLRLSMNLALQIGLGERALTDFRHLTEQLSRKQLETTCSPRKLLRWLGQKISGSEGATDDDLVRLESDADRVQVVTVHCSKGLEYPVVFCPFLWEGRASNARRSKVYSNGEKRIYDYIDQFARELEENEAREALRKQYVALTRAKHQLWVFAAKGGPKNTKAPLHHWGVVSEAPGALLNCPHIAEANLERLRSALVYHQPPAAPIQDAVPLLERVVRKNWLLHSYSSLAGHETTPVYSDRDVEVATPLPSVAEPSGVFALPKGAVFGTQVHELFETLDFEASAEVRLAAVQRMCEQAGYAARYESDLLKLVNQTLDTPLVPETFCLADISCERRLVEMDFHFPICSFKRAALAELTGSPVQIPQESCEGFIKGFIDLIFEAEGRYWIADYKTNYLGSCALDYSSDALLRAMQVQGYVLQLHLYTLALHRYLKLKLPDYAYEKHMGGAFYLFVRGMGHGNGGIYFDRVPEDRILAMDQLFTGDAT
jgi:exodeoxyribonuclease V beta subunit